MVGPRLVVAGVCAAALALTASTASAAGLAITPTRTDDPATGGDQCTTPPLDCSLRNALLAAQPGGVVDLRGAPGGTFDVTGPALRLARDVSLVGAGTASSVIARTAGSDTVLKIGNWPVPGQPYDALAPRSDAAVSGVTITGGAGHGWGGGIAISDGGTVTLTDLRITGNSSGPSPDPASGVKQGAGAGLFVLDADRVTVLDSEISNNTATSDGVGAPGGGVYASGPMSIVNSTITGNSATNGGGIYQATVMDGLVLDNDTIAGNTATGGTIAGGGPATAGGNIFDMGGTITFANTIVADGHGAAGGENCADDSSGLSGLESAGNNLESPTTECEFTAPSDQRAVTAPGLAPLADNGGGTWTMALAPGSPAIDGGPTEGCRGPDGQVLTTDQRGLPRPVGARCDIGAYEAQADERVAPTTCSLVTPPQLGSAVVTDTATCDTTSRVTETATLVIARGGASTAAVSAVPAARSGALGRLTRVVRRHQRAVLRLRLTAASRSRIRSAIRHGYGVRAVIRLSARRTGSRPPRHRHR